MVLGLMGFLTATIVFVYHLQVTSWNESYIRSSIRDRLSQALELATHRLRQAQTIEEITDGSITFTADLGDGIDTYRLYLYNAEDPEPEAPYTQNIYSLRMAKGLVDYGEGGVLAADIAQPSGAVFSINGQVINITLTTSRENEEVTMRTSVRPRNL